MYPKEIQRYIIAIVFEKIQKSKVARSLFILIKYRIISFLRRVDVILMFTLFSYFKEEQNYEI